MSIRQIATPIGRGRIPATVITGFLGAGKTSLMRHVLATAAGKRLALIINEFGDLGVDGALLAGCGVANCADNDIIELANGCICCTVADAFLPTIEALIARTPPPDGILIETSGLALPKPLVKAFSWPEIRSKVTVDGVIAVIDAPAVADGRFADDPEKVQASREADPALDHDEPLKEVFEDQLQCADLVILNKTDLVDRASLAELRADLRSRLRPSVKVVPASFGAVSARILLGLGAGAEDDLDDRPSHHDGAADDHDHDDFESFNVNLDVVRDVEALIARLRATMEAHDVLRLKGFVEVAGREMRHVVQGVGTRVCGYYDRPWRAHEVRQSRLVLIGRRGLDRAAIEAAIVK